jgi:hypothetical protein
MATSRPKNAPKDPNATLPTFEVLAPLQHDGAPYAPGDLVELNDDAAAALLACNPPVVKPVGAAT